jgi:hypothetical protein
MKIGLIFDEFQFPELEAIHLISANFSQFQPISANFTCLFTVQANKLDHNFLTMQPIFLRFISHERQHFADYFLLIAAKSVEY